MNRFRKIIFLIFISTVNISSLLGQDFSCIKLYKVSFSGSNYDIVYDDDRNKKYIKPHWLDNNLNGSVEDAGDHKYPVCYKYGKKMKIEAGFKIDPPTSSLPSIIQSKLKIKGTCNANGKIFNLEPKSVTISGGEITYPSTETTEVLPESIQFYDPLEISWSISMDGGDTWNEVGKSKNRVYVRLTKWYVSDPILFYTSVHLACSNSIGLTGSDKNTIVNNAYSHFTGKDVKRVDGMSLQYWGPLNVNDNSTPPQDFNFTTWGLLMNKQGRCGSFANFFIDIVNVNNIGIDMAPVYSKPFKIESTEVEKKLLSYMKRKGYDKNDYKFSPYQFLVKNWDLTRADSIAVDVDGVKAQGPYSNPMSNFSDHALVKSNNLYFDPSYGTSPCTPVQWEDISIDGFGVVLVNLKDKSKSFMWYYKVDSKGVLEINFSK